MVIGIRLITGEDIIGKKVGENESVVTLSEPRSLNLVPAGPDKMSLSLGAYIPYAVNKEFTFPRSLIQTQFEPVKELVSQYTQMTTGIIMPTPENISQLIKP